MGSTRYQDEKLLECLSARRRCASSKVAAFQCGVSLETFRRKTNAVLSADIDQSGEARDSVIKHYWPSKVAS